MLCINLKPQEGVRDAAEAVFLNKLNFLQEKIGNYSISLLYIYLMYFLQLVACLCLSVFACNIVSASYPALHALHFAQQQQQQQKSVLSQQDQHQRQSLEQTSAEIDNEFGSTVTSSEDYDSHPQYSFAYDVRDSFTGDDKQQEEKRDGDVVQGQVRRFFHFVKHFCPY